MSPVTVRLIRGASYTTPFGARVKKAKPLTLPADHPHVPYYRRNTAFEVTDGVPARRVPMRRRHAAKTEEPAEEPEAVASDPPPPERTEADLKRERRSSLIDMAVDLGCAVSAEDDTKKTLIAKILAAEG